MKFTYLLGAGASAQSIPIVKRLPDELLNLAEFILSEGMLDAFLDKEINEKKDLFCTDLIELARESKIHASIDTYAKKLYLTKNFTKLKKLKALLDAFFTEHQIINLIDKRYDAFLATLFFEENNTLKLPSNLNILSWNYDFQFELSLSNFILSDDIFEIEKKFKFIPNMSQEFTNINEFCLIKLNGTAAGLIDKNVFIRKTFFDLKKKIKPDDGIPEPFYKEKNILPDIIRNYHDTIDEKNDKTSSVMFAWEKEPIVIQVRDFAKEKVIDTSILVVIGYSFPTFNREIDKLILKQMTSLRKIVIQALPEDINSIIFRLKSLLRGDIEIQSITAGDEFFIPFEF